MTPAPASRATAEQATSNPAALVPTPRAATATPAAEPTEHATTEEAAEVLRDLTRFRCWTPSEADATDDAGERSASSVDRRPACTCRCHWR
ncbi:MAG: hypothetical protein ACR2GH_11155 [Pseudonocardia sp.]